MTLRDLFDALDKPSGRNRFALGPQICPGARLAKSSAGHPAVLVAVKRTGASAPRRLANLEYDPPRKLEVLSKTGKARVSEYATLECPSKDEHVREMFLRFVSIFLEPGDSGLNEGDLDLRLDALVALFRSLSQPSEQTIQGLWAELAVIAWSADVKTALSSWHSSPRNLHDFGGGADRLEVKSAGIGLREHAFRLEQLGEQPNGRTLIASVVVEEVEIGQSVAELVEVILARVDNDGESRRRLETIVARSLGQNWRQSGTLKFDVESARRTLQIYDARAVPSVQQPLRTEIKHVHFVVDLSTAPSLALAKARKLGTLFAQLLPLTENE